MWRSPDLHHQLSVRDPSDGSFRNVPVKDVAEAVALAHRYSEEGLDVYFGCAEYLTPESRTAANAAGAWAFWIDVDCGKEKSEAGKGYADGKLALQAIQDFCRETGLPAPTLVVESGSGLHAYWIFVEFLAKEQWQETAKKFKTLCKTLGLLADPSRTADLASVLRIPGTLNYKYDPPRPVVFQVLTNTWIETAEMLEAIERAYERGVAST